MLTEITSSGIKENLIVLIVQSKSLKYGCTAMVVSCFQQGPLKFFRTPYRSRVIKNGFASKVTFSVSRNCFGSVGSCDFVDRAYLSGQTERSTKSHELNTKLIST